MLRLLCTVWGCAALIGCEQGHADVLQEFPPPRLARENAAAPATAVSTPADCKVTWRLFGRKSRETYHLAGRGTFEVAGDPARPISGIVAIDASASTPELRGPVAGALQTRGRGAPWLWRILNVASLAPGYDGLARGASSANTGSGASEIELNGVRTRQLHDISFKLTPREDEAGALDLETQLRLDLAAHQVRGITLADDSPPRRSDLVVQCRFDTSSSGE